MTYNTLFVNLFGGPCTGKSTLASDLFSTLKKRNIECELVTEFAKDVVWDNSLDLLEDQIFIFGNQYHRCFRLNGKVQIVITDSPIIQGLVYKPAYLTNTFDNLVIESYSHFNNLNILLERTTPYNPNGRNQTEDEAKEKDRITLQLLKDNNLTYHAHNDTASIIRIIQTSYKW